MPDAPSDLAPEHRRRLAAAGRALVHARYDWDAVMPRFLNLVDDVALQRATVHNA